MTIASTVASVVGLGNGATTAFTYSFLIPSSGDVRVTYVNAAGVATVLASSQYNISGIGDSDGGTVTYPLSGSPIPAGSSITIARVLDVTQPTSLENQGGFYPRVVEAAVDRVVMLVQQIAQGIGSVRALLFPASDVSPQQYLPVASARANKYLAFDANGNPVVLPGTSSTPDISSSTVVATGATTARSMADRFADRLCAKDFGAKGDGVTDDTDAIVAGLTALYARGGGILFFPAGEYCFTTFDISRTYNVILQGEGNSDTPQSAATVLRCTKRGGLSDIAINVAAGGTTTNALQAIRDMNITGGTEAEIGIDATHVITVNNGVGVRFNIAHRMEMVNVSVFGFAKYGVLYEGGTFYGRFEHCNFQFNGLYGLYSDNSNTTYLLHCHFHYNGIGLRSPPQPIPLFGCIFQGNASSGLYIDVNGNYSLIGCYFEVNNLCDQDVGADVLVSAAVSANVTVQDCYFATTYDTHVHATNNFRGRFHSLAFLGCTRMFAATTYFNVFGITECNIVDYQAQKLTNSNPRFIDQSTTTTIYTPTPGPNGDSEDITVTGASITIGLSTMYADMHAAGPQTLTTITAKNSQDGRLLVIRMSNNNVTLQDGTGNLQLAGDFVPSGAGYSTVNLVYKRAVQMWFEVSRSLN